MKKIIIALSFVWMAVIPSQGQPVHQNYKNPDILHSTNVHVAARKEFIIPSIPSYNVYKADLHTHTVYSDGRVGPEFRMYEAWLDGLDVMAVTEHIEYRRYEDKMVEYMTGYVKEDAKAVNFILHRPTTVYDSCGIQVDLNYVLKRYETESKKYDITIIPGGEITRDPTTIGHYNALFVKDNNKIYDPDPIVAIRNAVAQGAIVMHNHPGWRKKNLQYTEFEKQVYKEGLISGIEVMNGWEFYPKAIERANKEKLFISSNTDVHTTTDIDYKRSGFARNMTFIFAKDKSLESLKEALLARRTLAWSFGNVAGEEKLLKEFFHASIQVDVIGEKVAKKKNRVRITNNSSIAYLLQPKNENPIWLDPFTTIIATSEEGKSAIEYEILNMWSGDDKHPKVKIQF